MHYHPGSSRGFLSLSSLFISTINSARSHSPRTERMADPNCPYSDLEDPSAAPLLDSPRPANRRQPSTPLVLVFSGLLALALFAALLVSENDPGSAQNGAPTTIPAAAVSAPSRGVSSGVSEKAFRLKSGVAQYAWSNDMLTWQRTGYHFQPEKNWMNDPNGPLFYKGWYHFFYQYNPDAAVWGNIVWGHAVSRDLINWLHLPIAMVADRWYDANGVWTGSATILPDGQIIMLYTGSTNASVQVQNLATPADPSDPLLVNWVKYSGNPVLVPPPGIDDKDFRDPTTAWFTPDRKWRITIGSKVNKTGISLVYDTKDFKTYELVDHVLHAVPGTGMWECVDFYPVSNTSENGLDTSVDGPNVKHVLKASLDDDKNDYYALGRYFHANTSWVPDNAEIDVGIGLRYDYGKFYASKTFYDQDKKRRILWGWIMETDSEYADVKKGWASVQAIPRTVVLDKKTGSNLIQWPVTEVESLRTRSKSFANVVLRPGSVQRLDVGAATQLDITAEFEVNKADMDKLAKVESSYSCSGSRGSAQRGAFGPFGLLVLADETRSEQTPVYFYIAKGADGNLKTFFCADESRSSKAEDVDKQIYGSTVPVLEGEKLTLRILVDHSIIESFAQGGRTCITSRVYPTKAIHGNAALFLFNNATETTITSSLKVWEMSSASLRPYSPTMPILVLSMSLLGLF